ncbi:MAG: hypothetical protein KDD48_06570 [Bdellovibrionales bacterium]|nr:hypothetical protein [Bdellovibrionales bacterium]
MVGIGFGSTSPRATISIGDISCSNEEFGCHIKGPAGSITFLAEIDGDNLFTWIVTGLSVVDQDCPDNSAVCTVTFESGLNNSITLMLN